MKAYMWLLLLPALISGSFLARAGRNGDGLNGESTQYGAAWWIWTVILLLIVAFIVWWAVRAGSKGGSQRDAGGAGGRMEGST